MAAKIAADQDMALGRIGILSQRLGLGQSWILFLQLCQPRAEFLESSLDKMVGKDLSLFGGSLLGIQQQDLFSPIHYLEQTAKISLCLIVRSGMRNDFPE